MKKTCLLLAICLGSHWLAAQPAISLSTDISLLRSFTPRQRFWAMGQSVQGNYHFSRQWTAYALVSYYTNGKFANRLVAPAKDPAANPQQMDYTAHSALRYRHLSFGLKYFFPGGFDHERSWNLYGLAGFGLLLAQVENTHHPAVDTLLYRPQQQAVAGTGNLKRLTFDAGFGAEVMLGIGIYVYGDLRTWIPASDYPTPFLYSNNVPRVLTAQAGFRVLFD